MQGPYKAFISYDTFTACQMILIKLISQKFPISISGAVDITIYRNQIFRRLIVLLYKY